MKFPQHYIRLLFITMIALVMAACHGSKKQRNTGYKAKKEDSLAAVARQNNLDFLWLKGRFDANVDLGNEQVSFNASFRMKKDSAIWISISKLGFNVVKVLLTQDSVLFIDKLQGKYYNGSYSFFKDSLKTDISFAQFQALLTGNFVPIFAENTYSASTENNQHIYCSPSKSSLGNTLETGSFFNGTQNINAIFLSSDTAHVERVYFQDPLQKYILDILYLSRQDGSFPFPKKMEVNLQSATAKPKKLKADFSKIESGTTPLDVKISIPKEYVRIK